MLPRKLATTSCVLEVERKFRSLAVRELTQRGGFPHFQSLHKLPTKTIRDAYYDKSDILSSAGAWIRKRNGEWQAKIKKGGNYTNSRFEELCGAHDIAGYIKRLTGGGGGVHEVEAKNFGLSPIATFATERQTWIANDEFHIVLDTMDFGYEVGEVELQQELKCEDGGGSPPSEEQKQRVMQEMDDKIVMFMDKYAWAFTPGEPKGKLTVYFERFAA